MAPTASSSTASDAEIHSLFATHHSATLLQALFVHGIAGIALAAFVVSLTRVLAARTGPARMLVLGGGLAAALLSLVQFTMEIAPNRHVAGDGDADGTAALFHAVNVVDTVKLVLLGVAIAAATRLAPMQAPGRAGCARSAMRCCRSW